MTRIRKLMKLCIPCCGGSTQQNDFDILDEIAEENCHEANEKLVNTKFNNRLDVFYKNHTKKKVTFSAINYKPKKLKYFDDFEISLDTILEDNCEEREELKYLILVLNNFEISEFDA